MNECDFGLESVKRQDDTFYNALIVAVGNLRDGEFTTKAIKKSLIMQTIKEYTGLNIIVCAVDGWQANVIPPRLTANNVFYRDSQVDAAASVIIDVTKTTLKGKIDMANAKVSGIFSDIGSELFIGAELFAPGQLNNREIAAVILHEVGHVFTYFQFLSTIAYGSMVIEQTVNNIFLTDNYQTKEIQIKAADALLGIDDENTIEEWVNTSKDNLEVILVTRFFRQLKTRSDTSYYDVRNAEQLADTFAVRMGAGLELAKATHKINKQNKVYGERSFFVHILAQTANLLKSKKEGDYKIREILLTMNQPKNYDDPKDRISFIKFQLIEDLKHIPRGDNVSRKDIVESIKNLDEILKGINPRRSLLTYIHQTFTKVGKSAVKQESQQKQLEEMLYNNLYYQSAKLKTLH